MANVTWDAIAGLTYVLESNEALGTAPWVTVGDELTAATNSVSQSDAVSSAGSRLYRVRQVQP